MDVEVPMRSVFLGSKVRTTVLRLYVLAQSVMAPVAYAVVGAVMDSQGRVLLVRHSYKIGLQLPIGGVNRGEAASEAVMREMREEVGLIGGTASLFQIYSRKAGWATNVLVLYRITDAILDFRPNMEVREVQFVDPLDPPPGCTEDTRRRLAELAGVVPTGAYW